MSNSFTQARTGQHKLAIQLGVPFALFMLSVIGALIFATIISYERSKTNAQVIPVEEALRLQQEIVRTLERADDSSQFASRNIGDTFENQAFLKDIVANNPTIFELTLYNATGTEAFKVTKPTAGDVTEKIADARGQDFFDKAMGGENYIGAPFLSPQNIPFVFWSYPIRNAHAEVIGVLRVTVDVSVLWDSISRSSASAYVVDEKGTLIISPHLEDTQKKESLLGVRGVQAFIAGEGGVTQYADTSGRQVAGTWEALPPTPWAVLVEIPVSSLFAQVYLFLGLFVLLLVVIVCLVIYELVNINRKVFKPLIALREGAEALGRGNLEAKVDVTAYNEFDTVAGSFNEMAAKLKESYAGLEQKVKARTEELDLNMQELKKLNSFMVDREVKLISMKKEMSDLKQKLGITEEAKK
jgi:HAMP domain-containing protein